MKCRLKLFFHPSQASFPPTRHEHRWGFHGVPRSCCRNHLQPTSQYIILIGFKRWASRWRWGGEKERQRAAEKLKRKQIIFNFSWMLSVQRWRKIEFHLQRRETKDRSEGDDGKGKWKQFSSSSLPYPSGGEYEMPMIIFNLSCLISFARQALQHVTHRLALTCKKYMCLVLNTKALLVSENKLLPSLRGKHKHTSWSD